MVRFYVSIDENIFYSEKKKICKRLGYFLQQRNKCVFSSAQYFSLFHLFKFFVNSFSNYSDIPNIFNFEKHVRHATINDMHLDESSAEILASRLSKKLVILRKLSTFAVLPNERRNNFIKFYRQRMYAKINVLHKFPQQYYISVIVYTLLPFSHQFMSKRCNYIIIIVYVIF